MEDLERETNSEGFRRLRREVSKKIGVDYSTYSKKHLRRRFHARMRVTGQKTFSRYLKYLRDSDEEIEKLKKLLTVNVTKFKRDEEVWDILREDVIPTLIKGKKDDIFKRLKFWSAGCATGEEPYSLAISFLESSMLEDFDCHILATDIDKEALSFARRGVYPPKALKNVTEHEKKVYFDKRDGEWAVTDKVKELVEFRHMDIFKNDFNKNFDLISCRNLMIYFNTEAKTDLTERLVDSLREGGFLILGMSETLRFPARDKMEKYHLRRRVFRKKE